MTHHQLNGSVNWHPIYQVLCQQMSLRFLHKLAHFWRLPRVEILSHPNKTPNATHNIENGFSWWRKNATRISPKHGQKALQNSSIILHLHCCFAGMADGWHFYERTMDLRLSCKGNESLVPRILYDRRTVIVSEERVWRGTTKCV